MNLNSKTIIRPSENESSSLTYPLVGLLTLRFCLRKVKNKSNGICSKLSGNNDALC